MPQGKCAFCGSWVTSGGTTLGKHSVACTACTPLALKWIEQHQEQPAPASDEAKPEPA